MATCGDVTERIDAFIDGELEPSVSVEVARHLGQCAPCDETMRAFLEVRDAIVAESDRAVSTLDLSTVWPAIDRDLTRVAEQVAWRARVAQRRRGLPRGLAWGAVAALAAGMALFLRPVDGPRPRGVAFSSPPGTTVAKVSTAKRLPNHVLIDRLAGKDIALRREPKSGTTMIWVNHEVERSGW